MNLVSLTMHHLNSNLFLNYKIPDLNIKHFYSLNGGRCYTFEPKNDSYPWSKDTMYVFYLHNSVSENMVQARRNEPPIQLSQMGRVAAGFHVFIHARSEMFADQEYQEDSFMEYIYVEAGENIKVNLRPSEFKQLPTKDNFCNESREYAKSKCHESCVHELITSYVGCSTPWMRNPQLPECSDFESIKEIIQSYTLKYVNFIIILSKLIVLLLQSRLIRFICIAVLSYFDTNF